MPFESGVCSMSDSPFRLVIRVDEFLPFLNFIISFHRASILLSYNRCRIFYDSTCPQDSDTESESQKWTKTFLSPLRTKFDRLSVWWTRGSESDAPSCAKGGHSKWYPWAAKRFIFIRPWFQSRGGCNFLSALLLLLLLLLRLLHYPGKNFDLRLCTVKRIWPMIAKSKRELYSTATYVPLRGIPLDYRRPSRAFIIRPLNLTVCTFVILLGVSMRVRKVRFPLDRVIEISLR